MITVPLTRRDMAGLFLAAVAARLAAVIVIQPRTGVDGLGFLASATALLERGPGALANLPLEHSPLYPLLLAVGLGFGLNVPWFAAIVQVFAGAITVVLLARLSARETGSRLVGLCAGCIAVIHITFVFWTAYLLSETLFLLLIVLMADRTLLIGRSSRPFAAALLIGVLGVLAIGLRPTGAAFMLAVLVTLVAVGRAARQSVALLLGGFAAPLALTVLLGVLSVSVLGEPAASAGAHVDEWIRSAIQNGLVETEQGRATSGVDLDVVPPPIIDTLPQDERDEFVKLGPLTFAAHHPDFVLEQVARKLRMFWSPALPDYSMMHALAASAYFLAFYALSAFGFVRAWRRTLALLCGASVVAFTLTSAITIVDYDQRYRLPVEAFLVPMAGVGLAWLLERVIEQHTRGTSVVKLVGPPLSGELN
jgi:hypothetical protein